MIEPKVVFATDLEGDLDEGLRVATRLAKDRVATLVLLHVAPLRAASDVGMLHESLDIASGRPARALEALDATDPTVPVERLLEVGEPDAVIPRVVAREGAALLVMELRQHWLRRSLVQLISGKVDCPIVTYRARPRRADGRAAPPRDEARPSSRGGVPIAVRLELLETLLEARVLALVTWLEHARDAARRIATSAAVRDLCASLQRGSATLADRYRDNLRLALTEHQHALGAIAVQAKAPDGASLLAVGAPAPDDVGRQALEAAARRDGTAIALPREADPGGSDGAYVIEVGAAMPVPGEVPGLLVLTFDARRDFLRILAQPGPTPSTETYAFDERGIMLSNSHFADELRRLGVLPDDLRVQTPGRVAVREPPRGGATPALTRMAAAATSGADGRDDAGYRDYRGVTVVGVWRWIPELGFGVAAEMDRNEPAVAPVSSGRGGRLPAG